MSIPAQGTVFSIESATPATFTAVGEVVDFTGPEESFSTLDPTNLADTRRRYALGLKDPGTMQIRYHLNYGDAGQDRMRSQFAAKARANFTLAIPAGTLGSGASSSATTLSFTGFITSMGISGSLDSIVEATATIQLDSDITEA